MKKRDRKCGNCAFGRPSRNVERDSVGGLDCHYQPPVLINIQKPDPWGRPPVAPNDICSNWKKTKR